MDGEVEVIGAIVAFGVSEAMDIECALAVIEHIRTYCLSEASPTRDRRAFELPKAFCEHLRSVP